ncbi:MAG: hypothetical protein II971_00255 [Firmicutes bacterium]|nr:hypothetical protein [Bacillota bacterium]
MKERRKRNIYVVLTALFLIAVAGLYTYLYLIPEITGALTPTVTVEYGSLQTSEVAHCTVVREETVVYAGESGTVSYYSNETEKTRKGTKVLDVYPAGSSGVAYTAQTTGFVSYFVDGWEESLDPDSLATLKPDELIELNIVPEDVRKNDASEGDALYKLVTNDTWYMVLSVPKEKREAYSLNSNVTVIFDKGSVRAKVSESYDRGDYAMIILKTGRYFEYFAQLRTQDVKVITSDYTGLLLPVTAVTQQDEENGVYVLGIDGNYSFVPVEILTQSGDTILVSADGDLRIYDTVMRNVTEDQEE